MNVYTLAQANIYAQTPAPERDFSYDLTSDGKGIVIIKYTGSNRNLVIPKTIEGYPVRQIGQNIYYDDWEYGDFNAMNATYYDSVINETFPSYLESVVIPEGVTYIAGAASAKLSSLRKVVLPSTIITIGRVAFYKCTRLTEINIPSGIGSILRSAF
jgi:hypothetical protein